MSPENKILRDLAAGPSTADSLALRLDTPTRVLEVILQRMKAEKKLTSFPLGEILQSVPVYRLIP